ncbi:Dna-directed rna polymerase subunit [Thalictrum thalictroides]|uniref:Dna-directed rna polymerase subunit n=1 Tax=Thalictrum thalictroides TaxID=46969 RepID=A0A7J6W070_THATH|nr:Dna-directed rna polymerase subunit [Thalictrum thalictroides]
MRYSIDDSVNEKDKLILMLVLHFHPKSTEKMGTGIQDIKVCVYEPNSPNCRCCVQCALYPMRDHINL